MKTKELISKIKNRYDYTVSVDGTINIRNAFSGDLLAIVSKEQFGIVNTFYSAFENMVDSSDLAKILLEYALTPLDKREDEPKFRVRFLPGGSNWEIYLNQNRDNASIFIDNDENSEYKQTIFTKSEYDKLQQKYRDWLPRFDKNDPHFEIIGGKINE